MYIFWSQHCGPMGSSRFPQRVLWGSLTVTLLIIITALIALIVTGKFTLQPDMQVMDRVSSSRHLLYFRNQDFAFQHFVLQISKS